MRAVRVLVVGLGLLAGLTGCDDSKEREQFAKGCGDAGFTKDQCTFLARMHSQAQSDSNANAALAAASMGLAAAAGGRR